MEAAKSPDFMALAFAEAEKAREAAEVPIGAIIVDGATGEILAAAHNLVETRKDPTAHAEIIAIRRATRKLGAKRLPGADLYVTLEPCAMCATAIAFARLRRLYYAAPDAKGGGVEHGARIFTQPTCHHRPDIFGGLAPERSAKLLKDFFKARR